MANRTINDLEFRAIKYVLENFMVDNPKGGKQLKSGWTDSRVAEEISAKLNLNPPLTQFNIKGLRKNLYGVAFTRKRKNQSVDPVNKPAKITFADLERRISALEARVYMPTHQVEMDLPKPVTSRSEIDELLQDWKL